MKKPISDFEMLSESSRLRFIPDLVSDPVPPWLLDILTDRQRVDLFRVRLDKTTAHLKTELEAIGQIQRVIAG